MKNWLVAIIAILAFATHTSAQTSRNGEFSASIMKHGGAKDRNEHNSWSATISNRGGSLKYQVSREIPFDMQFPSVYVGDNGSSIVVYVFVGQADFYNAQGNLVHSYFPFARKTAEHEQIIKCSTAGDRAAFLISTRENPNAELIVTDLNGNELWHKSLSGRHASEVQLSSDGQHVAAGSYLSESRVQNFSEIFQSDGKLIRTLKSSFRFGEFLPGRFVFSGRNSVTVATLSGNESYTWNTGSPQIIVTNLKSDGQTVACSIEKVQVVGGTPTYINPQIVLLDEKAGVVRTSTLSTTSQIPAELAVDDKEFQLRSEGKQTAVPRSESR